MGRVLPLLALRAFVETGRKGSLKAAAEAMGVTSGAVSQQIRLLEHRVGSPCSRAPATASAWPRPAYGLIQSCYGLSTRSSAVWMGWKPPPHARP